MVGKPNTWWGSHTWWAAHIHGGLASQQAIWWGARLDGGQGGARGRPRGRAPLAPMPPCMWAAHHVWLPHHVFGFPTMYFDQGYQVSRYQMSRYPGIQISGIRYQISGTRQRDIKARKKYVSKKSKISFFVFYVIFLIPDT